MASSNPGTILITGGTGKVGTCIAHLCASKAIPHLVASRSAPSDLQHSIKFDWLDRTTWGNPFTTSTSSPPVTAVFLVAPPTLDSSPILNDFIDLARGNYDVKRFVLLGSTAIEPGGPVFGKTAEYLADLGGKGIIEFGIMRPTWFQDNWSQQLNLLKPVKEERKCYSATGDGKIPWVFKFDIAECALHALTAEKPVNGDLFILGPELLSYQDCANILSDVIGEKIVHVNLSEEELAEYLHHTIGIPVDYAKGLALFDLGIKHGSEEKTNNTVFTVTGREPKTFREFAEENKAIWT